MRGERRPPTTPRFHRFLEYQRSPHTCMHETLREYGDFLLWRSLRDAYLVNHPEFVRPVLSQSYEHFSKKTLGYRVLAQIMGNGLVTNDGPDWVRQRRLVQPSFSHRTVQSFDRTINALAASMLDEWDRRAGDDRIWLDREMSKLTFRIVGATLFGRNIEGYADEVREISEITNLQPFEPRALMTLLFLASHPLQPQVQPRPEAAGQRRLRNTRHPQPRRRRDRGHPRPPDAGA